MASAGRALFPLIYTAMISSVVSSLGMLLVPTIAAEMGVPLSSAQWMLTVNLLVGAVSTPIMGRLSDGPRKKRLLMISLMTIACGSLLASWAPNFTVFLAGRALQGLAYGIVPVTIALARNLIPAPHVHSSISSLSVTVSVGLGLGYPLTGLIAESLGYRWAFGFGTVFAVSAVLLVWLKIPADVPTPGHRHRFDYLGTVLLGLGLFCLLLGISEGSNWGFRSAWMIATESAAVLFLVAWGISALKVERPLVNLRVFRQSDVVVANLTALSIGAVMYVALSMVSLVAQAPTTSGYGFGLPLVLAGLMMVPLSVGSLLANRLKHLLFRRIGMAPLLVSGMTVVAAATCSLCFAHASPLEVLVGMLVLGIGVGLTFAAMPVLINGSVAAAGLGSAVSFNQVLRTIGGALGSASSGAILASSSHGQALPSAEGIQTAFATSAAVCAAVAALLFLGLATRKRRRKWDDLAERPRRIRV